MASENRVLDSTYATRRWQAAVGRSSSPGVNPILLDMSFSEPISTIEEGPGPVAELTTPPGRRGELHEPEHHKGTSPKADTAFPDAVAVGEPPSTKQSTKPSHTYSFIGGCLIGISITLSVFALSGDEDSRASGLFTSLALASAGIAMHLRGAKTTRTPWNGSFVAAKVTRGSFATTASRTLKYDHA